MLPVNRQLIKKIENCVNFTAKEWKKILMNEAKESRAVNRVIIWCEGQIENKADIKQTERLIGECGLIGANAMNTTDIRLCIRNTRQMLR